MAASPETSLRSWNSAQGRDRLGDPDHRVIRIRLLEGIPAAAVMFSKAIDYLVSAYQKIVEIERPTSACAMPECPTRHSKKISEEADPRIGSEIEDLTRSLLGDATRPPDPGRRNELAIDLRDALAALAKRIDQGYVMDVRAGSLRRARKTRTWTKR